MTNSRFLVPETRNWLNVPVPRPTVGVVQMGFRWSWPNISQALVRHRVSNGVFLG